MDRRANVQDVLGRKHMHMRKGAVVALAVVGLTALVASPASAQRTKKLEPLNQ
jgi:hypothetical protein